MDMSKKYGCYDSCEYHLRIIIQNHQPGKGSWGFQQPCNDKLPSSVWRSRYLICLTWQKPVDVRKIHIRALEYLAEFLHEHIRTIYVYS